MHRYELKINVVQLKTADCTHYLFAL